MGQLTQSPPSLALDGYPLILAGPQTRTLTIDGSGWFGTVDLPPGQYVLAADMVTPSMPVELPVTIVAGAVTQQSVVLSAPYRHSVYLPLALK
jgi:hypothetical protein